MTTHSAVPQERLPAVAFVCPFTLIKPTGTPIRANLTIQAARRFARCHVISLGGYEGEHDHEIQDVWGTRRPDSRQFRVWVFARKGAGVLADIRPKIVHAFGPLGMLPALRLRPLGCQPRLVLELHGLLGEEVRNHWPGGRLFHRFLDRIAVRRADAIIAMSYSQREILLKRYGITPQRITVVWGPVDLDLFAYREPVARDALRVGYAGNDGPWQGVEDAMAAAASFRDEPHIAFRFIGIREDRLQPPAGVATEYFPGASRAETARLLSECDILLSPRRGKAAATQYPFKLSAYLAVGRPIIATDVSDQRHILEAAGCGVVVPPGLPEAIAAAIRQLQSMSHADRVAMGVRGRRFAEAHLSLDRFQETLAGVYAELGAGKPASPR
jgi:glycosyltransferase involved in cell wall biosynthesis